MDEIKFNYYQEYETLGYILYPMLQISDKARRHLNIEHIKTIDYRDVDLYAIILYSKIALTAYSLYRLLPEGKEPQVNKSADVSSIATMGRNIIENFNLLFFLCIDSVTIMEIQFRRMVAFYHSLHERHRFGKKMGVNTEELAIDKTKVDEFRKKVEDHPYFVQLDRKQQKHVLNGRMANYLTRIDISRKYAKNVELLDALYLVLSNFVHSGIYGLKLSFDGETFGCDNESNRDKIANILYLINYYVGKTIITMIIIHPESVEEIDNSYVDVVKKLIQRY